ncbi:hypothetical protein NEHOM01_1509 [Nematocida homosporus]|uniref:uncharacterized protein n=1 Tax=Nematocida homosporus TaxID=1912981 RepID=UPI002220E5BD|nr:uncharacterized protein NEHOM01_1509 [Nematocida homosporus]KAI5186497.1 hypothetical protein NEHOM01_1509 [Nematocida homosporus]
MNESSVITVRLTKPWHIKTTRSWIGLVLCHVLVWLSSVSGVDDMSRTTEVSQQSQNEMTRTLRMIGFAFGSSTVKLQVTAYVPNLQKKLTSKNGPALNPSLGPFNPLDNTPYYMIETTDKYIVFTSPKLNDESFLKTVLAALRTIAIIKCPRVVIEVLWPKGDVYQESLQILTRVIHIVDCKEMEVLWKKGITFSNIDKETKDVCLRVCLDEATNTLEHANYTLECQLNFSSQRSNNLAHLLDSGIVLHRRFSSVCLMDEEFKSAHLLSKLPLANDYTILFLDLPKVAEINLSVLQTSPPQCAKIVIEESNSKELTLTGLKNAVDKHPMLALETNWETFQHLCKPNKPKINVHAIILWYTNECAIQTMIDHFQEQTQIQPHIFAKTVTSKISEYMPCDGYGYYRYLYSKEAYSKYGISVDETQVQYEGQRTDLKDTIDMFFAVNALSKEVVAEVKEEGIMCCGDKLSEPNWSPRKKVDIQLDYELLTEWADNYIQNHRLYFCQNIYYTLLNIIGNPTPREGQAINCANFLCLFQNITGQKMHISNVRDGNQTTSKFSLSTLQAETANSPRYKLNMDVVVLENVDDDILYWIFGHYDLCNTTEVYILNHGFTNLDIAQLLSHPIGRNISKLVLNDFTGLEEVVHYQQPDQIKNLSLFKYIDIAKAEGREMQSLNLDKLFLSLDNADFDIPTKAISALWDFGIQPSAMLFKDYITKTPTNAKPTRSMILGRKLTLYGITLQALQSDWVGCQAKQPSQSHLGPNLTVEELVLMFSGKESLTETALVDSVRWTACRFKALIILRLVNVSVSETEQNAMTSRNYWVWDLDSLELIQIESATANIAPIKLPIHLYHKSWLLTVSNTTPEFTAIASKTVFRLLTCIDQIKTLLPEQALTKASFKMIINDITANQKTPSDIICPVCHEGICVDSNDKNPKEGDTLENKQLEFNSEHYPITFCYLKCTHMICSRCVAAAQAYDSKLTRCTLCKRADVFDDSIHRLISVPLSSFVAAKGSHTSATESHKGLKDMAFKDDHIYFYIAYRNLDDLYSDLTKTPNYDDSHPIHII